MDFLFSVVLLYKLAVSLLGALQFTVDARKIK